MRLSINITLSRSELDALRTERNDHYLRNDNTSTLEKIRHELVQDATALLERIMDSEWGGDADDVEDGMGSEFGLGGC